jgi:phospholipase C
VYHVYDQKHLDRIPRRYTVEGNKKLRGSWDTQADQGKYDLWILGPNGFHRRLAGDLSASGAPDITISYDPKGPGIELRLRSDKGGATFTITANAYFDRKPLVLSIDKNGQEKHYVSLSRSANWYDFTVTVAELPGFIRRFAGRVETGADSWSDPAQGGQAIGDRS